MPRSFTNAVTALSAMLLATALSWAAAATPASAQTLTEEQVRAEISQQRAVAASIDRESEPVAWAVAQTELAGRLHGLGDNASLAEAAALYRAALTVLTPETTPAEWLLAQEGLGDTLLIIGSSRVLASVFGMRAGSSFDPGVDARDSALAFRAALTVRTRESDPLAWARLQIRLGFALNTWTTRQRFAQAPEVDAIQGEAESAFARRSARSHCARIPLTGPCQTRV